MVVQAVRLPDIVEDFRLRVTHSIVLDNPKR